MSDGTSIRVMIVDDHDMVRIGLRVSIDSIQGMQVAGEAKGGREAQQLYREIKPDVVLMDLIMPEINGIDAARSILNYDPEARIIALTSFNTDELIHKAIQCGVKGYVIKNVSMRELSQVIRNVFNGQTSLSQEVTQALVRIAQSNPDPQYSLTPSETKVLRLIALGMSNNEIAEELVISVSTAKKHVSNIISKMDVSNRAEAAALAIQYELVDISPSGSD